MVGIKSGVDNGTAINIPDDEVGAEESDTGALNIGSSRLGMKGNAAGANTDVLDVGVEELETVVIDVVIDTMLTTPVVANCKGDLRGSRTAAEID